MSKLSEELAEVVMPELMKATALIASVEFFYAKGLEGFAQRFPDPTKAPERELALFRLMTAWKELAAAEENMGRFRSKKGEPR